MKLSLCQKAIGYRLSNYKDPYIKTQIEAVLNGGKKFYRATCWILSEYSDVMHADIIQKEEDFFETREEVESFFEEKRNLLINGFYQEKLNEKRKKNPIYFHSRFE